MNKRISLLLLSLCCIPTISIASFTDMYSTWVEQLLGNPTQRLAIMDTFASYGQNVILDGSISTPDGDGSLHATIDMQTDLTNNLSGSIHMSASGNTDTMSGQIDVGADLIVASGSVYIQPHITTLPTDQLTDEQKAGFQLVDGKWLELPTQGNDLTLASTIDPIELSTQLVSQLKANPVFQSTQQFQRNGYDIHLLALNNTGVEQLVAGVVNTITTPLGLPAEASLQLPSASDLNTVGVRTYGVVGKKGDEIKLGFIMKHISHPEYFVVTSTTTPTTSKLHFRMLEKLIKQPTTQFIMETSTPSATQQTTDLSLIVPDEGIDLGAQLHTTLYDAGTSPITAPTGAILFDNFGP